ncbi:MAG TPA: CvpA family protein [Gemmataceae bacterium]|nr:CvpA family protein [Gemmataceae bacterium]
MFLGFLTIVIMLAGTYAFWRQGVLAAFAMTVNILLAGLLAFNFFEPIAEQLAPMLADSFLSGYEDSFCLVVLFSAVLVFLRWASNALIHTVIEYHPGLQQGGAVLFGMMAGYLIAGFLVCVVQMLPANEHFLGFEARVDAPEAKVRHRILPPDRVWLALMHRASIESLGWDETPFDADGSFELRYRARRHADQQESHE